MIKSSNHYELKLIEKELLENTQNYSFNFERIKLWTLILFNSILTSDSQLIYYLENLNELIKDESTPKSLKTWYKNEVKNIKENTFKIKIVTDNFKPLKFKAIGNKDSEELIYDEKELIKYKKMITNDIQRIAKKINYDIKILNLYFHKNKDGYIDKITVFFDENYLPLKFR